MLHMYLDRRPPAFMQRSGGVLHFAPEPHLHPWMDRIDGLRVFGTDYDVNTIRACGRPPRFASDMMYLALRDASMDGIFCIHVMEHVPVDHKGLQELFRVLKPGAEAVLMVPLMMGWKESQEFGTPDPNQFGHVRGYSPLDFEHRLTMFSYEKIMPRDFLSAEEVKRYVIPDSQVIFLCRRTG
jgi:SAM-dependent methyltransferase